MKDFIHAHFDILVLLFIFVFATFMLAFFPMRDEMARWIEGGAVLTILARSMGIIKAPTTPADKPPDLIKPPE